MARKNKFNNSVYNKNRVKLITIIKNTRKHGGRFDIFCYTCNYILLAGRDTRLFFHHPATLAKYVSFRISLYTHGYEYTQEYTLDYLAIEAQTLLWLDITHISCEKVKEVFQEFMISRRGQCLRIQYYNNEQLLPWRKWNLLFIAIYTWEFNRRIKQRITESHKEFHL